MLYKYTINKYSALILLFYLQNASLYCCPFNMRSSTAMLILFFVQKTVIFIYLSDSNNICYISRNKTNVISVTTVIATRTYIAINR